VTGRRLGAELLGTGLLLVAIVGSGIVASTDGPASAQLFQHAVVVGAALAALILTFGPVSGAHFNPIVTAVDAGFGGLSWRLAGAYATAQVSGAALGVVVTNLLFDLPAVSLATTDRSGGALIASEALATFGLLLVIFGMVRADNARAVPGAVGAYIAAAIYFTPSAAFANPAVALARVLSDTYTGIDPGDVPGFLAGQAAGAALAFIVVRWLFHPDAVDAAKVVVPHGLDATATSTSFVPLLAERFTRERLAAAKIEGLRVSTTPTVLFLCVHNAGRSQMAAGWLGHLSGDRVQVLSGGSNPGERINHTAVEAMAEVGIDIANEVPRPWTDETLGAADVVITMGCGDACPVIPGKRYLDWELADPAGQEIEQVRPIRDEIEERVRGLMADLGVAPVDV
jgi:arsenate reductase